MDAAQPHRDPDPFVRRVQRIALGPGEVERREAVHVLGEAGVEPAVARAELQVGQGDDVLAQRLGIAPQAITIMYNGREHVFRWNAAASGLPARLSGIRPFVLLLGSRARHKNAAFILRQAEALDALGIDLIVAGGSATIFSRTESVRASNIRGLGFVTDDDLAWLYAHALCLAFPSRSEGFGLPLLEAMTLGCPVVASDQSCLPEICGEAALLAGPDDAPAWQAHFRNLIASPDLRADLRGRGLERAKAFSWRDSAQGYLDLLRRL